MVKTSALIWGILATILLLTGAGATWLTLNKDRLAQTLIERLEAHLLTDVHIDHIDLDIWSHFPHVSIVLHNTYLLGSHSPADTLMTAQELSVACNAFQLIGGNYNLTAVDLYNASLSIVSRADGWNTQVWSAGDGANQHENFAIDHLALESVSLSVDGKDVFVDDATLHLNWTETGLMAAGKGQLASVEAGAFSTEKPLTCSGKLDWNFTTDTAHVAVTSLTWFGLKASLQATLNDIWTAKGAIESVSLEALREFVTLPADYESLDSDATADGKFTWDGQSFKSNWTVLPELWDIPFGENMLNIRGEARVWLKFEGGTWRADAPHVALNTNGANWSGKVERILFDVGSFEATGSGMIQWPQVDLQSIYEGDWPQKGQLSWDGMIKRKRNGTMDWNGSWMLTEGSGTLNGTPWTATGSGFFNGTDFVTETLEGTWDEIALTGNFKGQIPLEEPRRSNWTGSLVLPQLNFNSSDTGSIALATVRLPFGMRAQCDVAVENIQYDGWQLGSADFAVEGDHGGWLVPRFRAETLDGLIHGDGVLSFNHEVESAEILLHPTAESWDLTQLFEAFNNFNQNTLRAEHLTGSFDASGSVQFNIDSVCNWVPSSLDVLGTASIDSGEVHNLEAFQDIANYLRGNRLMAPLVDPDDLAQRLEYVQFEHVESPIYISKGTVQLPHTVIRSSAMNITLEGQYNFDSSMDYTLGFAMRDLRASSESEFGEIADDGLGHQFFVSMTGTVVKPQYNWDREAQKNHRRENFQREKDLLKDLFRKSSP
ncbi:MAG TPA: hypothetical protein DD635_04770 [Flavobacteriales bacterium]|nr:hypothetical protein [Flavobacteriales bacterium]